MDTTTSILLSTTDAKVWAKEWCRIARQIVDVVDPVDRDDVLIDEGWMIGWFANAFCVQEMETTLPLQRAIKMALQELGVPGEGYPAPVANAIDILTKALDGEYPSILKEIGIES